MHELMEVPAGPHASHGWYLAMGSTYSNGHVQLTWC